MELEIEFKESSLRKLKSTLNNINVDLGTDFLYELYDDSEKSDYNGEVVDEINYALTTFDSEKTLITLGISSVFHARIDTDTISSKKKCYEIRNEAWEYIKENYPVIEIECVQYDLSSMLNSEICLLLYGTTCNSMITELWRHANFLSTRFDLTTNGDSISQVDLDEGNHLDDERFEKNLIKELAHFNQKCGK